MVNVLLGALRLVAWSQKPASRVGCPAGLQSGRLGVVVLSVSVFTWDVLEDDTPESLDVDGTSDLGIVDVRGAEITLRSDPV